MKDTAVIGMKRVIKREDPYTEEHRRPMVKFLFIRDENKFPVGCLAYEIERKKYNNEEDVVRYAFSVYHSKDKFNKKVAREVACGRLYKKPIEFRPDVPNSHPRDLLHDICYWIFQNPTHYAMKVYSETPSWARKLQSALDITMERLVSTQELR